MARPPGMAAKPLAVAATNRRTAHRAWAPGPPASSDGVVPKPIFSSATSVAPLSLDLLQQRRALGRTQPRRIAAGHGAARPGRALVRRADDHAVEVGQAHAAASAGSPSHQRACRRRWQVLAAAAHWQAAADRRQARGSRPAPSPSELTTKIGLLAHGLQQPHRPGKTRGVELQRVGDRRRQCSARSDRSASGRRSVLSETRSPATRRSPPSTSSRPR